ncbi:MAG TPA: hypothetical protein PLV68_21145, partial [Ilumatobacteraceae bacterium]|nr:hypothetical protein [Ilumatobacteraceae bacterium]
VDPRVDPLVERPGERPSGSTPRQGTPATAGRDVASRQPASRQATPRQGTPRQDQSNQSAARFDTPRSGTPRQGPARQIKTTTPRSGSRDRTPNGVTPRGVPARQFQQHRGPQVVIAILLLLAAVVALALWVTRDTTSGTPFTPDQSGPVDAQSQDATGDATESEQTTPGPVSPAVPATILGVTSFGDEHPDEAVLAIDGDTGTGWTTVCYNDKYFNGKPGVGLIAQMSGPATGRATIAISSAPFQLDVYASDADVAPTTIGGWGAKVVSQANGSEPGTVDAQIEGARWVLALLREAGTGDNGCTTKFPYQGAISEIRFTNAAD